MQIPWDRLDKIKKPVKLGIWFGLIVLLAVGFYFGLYAPAQNKIQGLNKQVEDLNTKISQHRSKVKEIPQIRERLKLVQMQFDVLSQYMPQQAEVDRLLRDISELAIQSGLNVILFQPNPQEKMQDFYAEISYQIKVEGPYLNVAQFFYQTSRMTRIVNVENIKMTKPELVDGTMILTTESVGKTFRFLTPAEIKAREEAIKAAAKKK